MNRKYHNTIAVFGFAMLFLPSVVVANDSDTGTITAPGVATQDVASDVIEIKFALMTEAASFEDAKKAADAVRKGLENIDEEGTFGSIVVDYDQGLLKQQSIRLKRGSKVENVFHLTCYKVKEGSLFDTYIEIVDRGLAVHPKLTIKESTSRISAEKTTATKNQLLQTAVRKARENAEIIALASGMKVVSPVSIYAAPIPVGVSGGKALFEEIIDFSRSSVSKTRRRKRFQVYSDLSKTERISVAVIGVFSASPL